MGGIQGSMWHSELVVYRPVVGATGGFYMPIMLGNRIEVEPATLLSLGGTAQTLPEGERSTLRSLHATIPVTMKYFVTRSFNVQLGAQGGYLLMAQNEEYDVYHLLNPLDFGAMIGLGIGTWNGLDFTLRYYNGLSNLLRNDATYFPANRVAQATVGKRFVQFKPRRTRRR